MTTSKEEQIESSIKWIKFMNERKREKMAGQKRKKTRSYRLPLNIHYNSYCSWPLLPLLLFLFHLFLIVIIVERPESSSPLCIAMRFCLLSTWYGERKRERGREKCVAIWLIAWFEVTQSLVKLAPFSYNKYQLLCTHMRARVQTFPIAQFCVNFKFRIRFTIVYSVRSDDGHERI